MLKKGPFIQLRNFWLTQLFLRTKSRVNQGVGVHTKLPPKYQINKLCMGTVLGGVGRSKLRLTFIMRRDKGRDHLKTCWW